MIQNATITPHDSRTFSDLPVPNPERGSADYPLSAADLLAFGRSPLRWRNMPPSDPDTTAPFHSVLRAMHLAPAQLPTQYVVRPETYQDMRLRCPTCDSQGPARTCRGCGIARVNTSVEREWCGTAKYCLTWTKDATGRGLKIVPAPVWQRATLAQARLSADPEVSELLGQSQGPILLTGTWLDQPTGITIPLRAIVDYAPASGQVLDRALGFFRTARSIAHGEWASRAYQFGCHLEAALAHALYAAATDDPRPTHLWSLVEESEPHIVGRRKSSPELLGAGSTLLEQLLAAYARCRLSGVWPAFDPLSQEFLGSWTTVYLEQWMTQGDGNAGSYWAISAPAGN